jgi:hypothetical protein
MSSTFTLMQTRRDRYCALLAMGIMSFCLFYYYVFHNPHFWHSCNVDAHYYISIAKNLNDGMGLYDGTTIPNSPIITSQNGIVFVELLLMKAGIQDKAYLYAAVATINYLFFLFSVVLLYMIARELKVPKSLNLLIIANLVFSGNSFTAIIVPINDGIAFALSLFGLFLCIKNYEMEDNWIYLLIFTSSVIGVHFRLQCLLIPFSAAFASLIVQRYKSFLIYLLVTISSIMVVYFPYRHLMEDGFSIHETRQYFYNILQADKLGKVVSDIGKGFSELFLKFGEGGGHRITEYAFPAFVIIAIIIIYFCIRKIMRREFKTSLLSFIILSTVMMYAVVPWHSARYIMIIPPLLMIMLGSTCRWKHIVGPLFAAYLLYSVAIILFRIVSIESSYYEQKRQTELVMPLFKNHITLFSEEPAASYFLFNTSSSSGVDLTDSKKVALLFGTDEFIMKGITAIRSECPNVTIDDYGRHWRISGGQYSLVRVTRLP